MDEHFVPTVPTAPTAPTMNGNERGTEIDSQRDSVFSFKSAVEYPFDIQNEKNQN